MDDIVIEKLEIKDIFIDDNFNCRGKMAPIDVEELAKDIQTQGLLQPVLVMVHNADEQKATGCKYKLVAGFRRTYAHKILKITSIPAVIKPHLDAKTALTINLAENLKRKDLNMLQEANAIRRLVLAGVIQEEIARQVGMSRGWVLARIDLLRLPQLIQEDAANGLITQYQIRAIAVLKNQDLQYAAVKKIKEARERGEKTGDIINSGRKKITPNMKVRRQPSEMKNMINLILDQLGGNLVTRALAWALGNISDNELYEDLGPEFVRPEIDVSGKYLKNRID